VVWPTRGQIYFARLDANGESLPPAEIKTPGTSGMRTGVLALSAPDGSTLVGWKKGDQLGGSSTTPKVNLRGRRALC